MNMIGFHENFEGLYHLIFKEKHVNGRAIKNSSVFHFPRSSLWNFWLGHLSPTRMQSLHNTFIFVFFNQKSTFDIFHYATYKRFQYNSIFNKAKNPFDVVHFDVWGPLAIKSCHDHSYFLTVVDDFSIYT